MKIFHLKSIWLLKLRNARFLVAFQTNWMKNIFLTTVYLFCSLSVCVGEIRSCLRQDETTEQTFICPWCSDAVFISVLLQSLCLLFSSVSYFSNWSFDHWIRLSSSASCASFHFERNTVMIRSMILFLLPRNAYKSSDITIHPRMKWQKHMLHRSEQRFHFRLGYFIDFLNALQPGIVLSLCFSHSLCLCVRVVFCRYFSVSLLGFRSVEVQARICFIHWAYNSRFSITFAVNPPRCMRSLCEFPLRWLKCSAFS